MLMEFKQSMAAGLCASGLHGLHFYKAFLCFIIMLFFQIFYLYRIIAGSCRLGIALSHTAISIILQLTEQPQW